MAELLLEIGTEELPASWIEPALEQLASQLEHLLKQNRLEPRCTRTAGTPRRLTIAAAGVPEHQPPRREEVVGPPAAVAFDADGNPTRAAVGFARSRNLELGSLKVKDTEKGRYVVAEVEHEGAAALEVLPGLLREAVLALTFPKSMRWPIPSGGEADAGGAGVRFARPIRWLVALLDSTVIPLRLAGLEAGRTSQGHPFLAPQPIRLEDADFDAYRQSLKDAFVIVEPEERRRMIRRQVEGLLGAQDCHTKWTAGELAEVANLVEYPRAVVGTFEDRFLRVPDCIVCAAMVEHQRYLPVWSSDGRRMSRFVVISNRTAEQDEVVREGNERVLKARLEDAHFFWDDDRKTALEARVPNLAGVTFLGGLGNNLQRTVRLEHLASRIAEAMGLERAAIEQVRAAAHLCKADLLTGLVGEFPTLQGRVGRELALAEGYPPAVADAIAEHYLPAGADDELPATPLGRALALADKLDVMACCFALGLLPSGSQDPYGLRRNALGVLLILEDGELDLSVSDLLETAAEVLEGQREELEAPELTVPRTEALSFIRDRLYHAALERGHPHDLVRAALAVGFDRQVPGERLNWNVRNFWKRLGALATCRERTWWPALVELVDRTYRIQRDLEQAGPLQQDLLKEKEERELGAVLAEHGGEVAQIFEQERYVEAAELYCSLFAEKVHTFFDRVFVNVEDEALRRNRKALCAAVYGLFADHMADLYLIESAEEG